MKKASITNEVAKRVLSFITIIAIVAMVILLTWKLSNSHLEVGVDNDSISYSPTKIVSMIDIGQWEFLTIDMEEIADTIAYRHFGSDNKLVRIYYGRMRLGVDLQKAKKDWIQTQGDTVQVTLPPVELLDNNFIDEAKTKAFFEIGSWNQASRDALYHQARRKMLTRGMTKTNIKMAQENAIDQFTTLFRSLGFGHVEIHF